MDVRVGLWRRLSVKELMLLNCGAGEDSWESLGLQGDPTSPFWRRSTLGFLWREWCWSWNYSTLATSCEELIHWKRLWVGHNWATELNWTLSKHTKLNRVPLTWRVLNIINSLLVSLGKVLLIFQETQNTENFGNRIFLDVIIKARLGYTGSGCALIQRLISL